MPEEDATPGASPVVVLGAGPARLLTLTLGDGLIMVAVGLMAGVAAAVPMALALRGCLFGIGALDPVTFLTVPAVLLGVALLACWLPARQVIAMPPAGILRE